MDTKTKEKSQELIDLQAKLKKLEDKFKLREEFNKTNYPDWFSVNGDNLTTSTHVPFEGLSYKTDSLGSKVFLRPNLLFKPEFYIPAPTFTQFLLD